MENPIYESSVVYFHYKNKEGKVISQRIDYYYTKVFLPRIGEKIDFMFEDRSFCGRVTDIIHYFEGNKQEITIYVDTSGSDNIS